MNKVILFDYKSKEININVFAEIEADGSLRVDGCDAGKRVKKIWGDYDYEYIITVTAEDLPKLCEKLQTTQKDLLQCLLSRFEGERAFSRFKKFLKNHDIPFDFFTWA